MEEIKIGNTPLLLNAYTVVAPILNTKVMDIITSIAVDTAILTSLAVIVFKAFNAS